MVEDVFEWVGYADVWAAQVEGLDGLRGGAVLGEVSEESEPGGAEVERGEVKDGAGVVQGGPVLCVGVGAWPMMSMVYWVPGWCCWRSRMAWLTRMAMCSG